jgi:hypothetical protein
MMFGDLSLGDLIEYLSARDPDTPVKIGIRNPHSYRGIYADLGFEPVFEPSTVGKWLEEVKPCLGHTFEGYKGGDFLMRTYTDCWLAYEGDSNAEKIGVLLMTLLLDDPLTEGNTE